MRENNTNNNNTEGGTIINNIDQYNKVELKLRSISRDIILITWTRSVVLLFGEVISINNITNNYISITIKLFNYKNEYVVSGYFEGDIKTLSITVGSRFCFINNKYNRIININNIHFINRHYNFAYANSLKDVFNLFNVNINNFTFNNSLYKSLSLKKSKGHLTETESQLYDGIKKLITDK